MIAETALPALLLVAIVAYALIAIRSKERARTAARHYCHQQGLALLDDTVVLKRLSVQRHSDGHIVLRRRYRFEFSSDGERRYFGEVVLSGRDVQSITTDAYRWSPRD